MSFGRGGSGGLGGLSINTGTANSLFGQSDQNKGGFFGTTPQPQQSGGFFGGQSNQQSGGLFGSQSTQPSGGLFGSQQTQQQAAGGLFGSQSQGGGLFGSSQSQPQLGGGGFGFGSLNQPSQSQPQQTGGLFGSFNQGPQSQPQQTGALFGQSTTPQQGGGLFGASLQQPQQAQQGGGLFGSQSQPQQSGGLFGSQSQPQQSTGLFGSSNVQNQPQQGGGLFGSSIAQPQTQTQQSGGLFGNLVNQNQNQQQQSGNTGLFGSLSNDNKPSLFGGLGLQNQQNQQNQQSQQPDPGLLGGNTLGGLSFGQSTAQPSSLQSQPMIPGVRIDVSNIRATTRFTDLHEDLQKELELIDALVLRQISCHNQCNAMMPNHAERLSYLPNDVEYVSRREKTLTETLMNDVQAIARVRDTIKTDAEEAKLSFAAIDNLRLLPQYHHAGAWKLGGSQATSFSGNSINGDVNGEEETSPRDLVAYFSQRADNMSQTLQRYLQNLAQVESHLRGVEARTGQQIQQLVFSRGRDGEFQTAEDQIRELAAVLRDFENGILGVAGKVGAAREGVQRVILGAAGTSVGLDGGAPDGNVRSQW